MMRRRAIIGRRVGAGVPASPSGIVFDSSLNIVWDGNSLVASTGPSQNVARCTAKVAPVSVATAGANFLPDATSVGTSPLRYQSDKGILVTNLGIGGQSWRKMNALDGGSATDVDGAFNPAKTNLLITWEGTNSLTGGRTVAQTVQDATDYVTARRAANPWAKIFTGTCLPRLNQSTDQAAVDADNLKLDQYNAYVLANYKAMGFDGVFDVRKAGSAFNLPDYNIQTFNDAAAAAGTYWVSSDPAGQHIHLNSDGYWYVVTTFVAPMLQSA
jgi:hypothetical protein